MMLLDLSVTGYDTKLIKQPLKTLQTTITSKNYYRFHFISNLKLTFTTNNIVIINICHLRASVICRFYLY
jgi:hypothetical protein